MRTHETTTGEGSASVICHYEFDSDGDLDALQVLFNGVDIVDALSDQQMGRLEDVCRAAAQADYEDTRYDTRIDAFIERMES
jgi:hypothetical protein